MTTKSALWIRLCRKIAKLGTLVTVNDIDDMGGPESGPRYVGSIYHYLKCGPVLLEGGLSADGTTFHVEEIRIAKGTEPDWQFVSTKSIFGDSDDRMFIEVDVSATPKRQEGVDKRQLDIEPIRY